MLSDYLNQFNISLTETDVALLDRHLDFVLEKNKALRLTAIHDYNAGVKLHILDSLLVLEELQNAPQGLMLDIGTGGGYPGIPLSVATGRPVVLLDSVKKKIHAINEFVERESQLKLSVSTLDLRAEELANERPEGFAVVLARAVSSLPSLVELASPLLFDGGQLIAHKGPLNEEELDRANKVAALTGMEYFSSREYVLPDGEELRTVYVFKKINKGEVDLPRRSGQAQRKPLA